MIATAQVIYDKVQTLPPNQLQQVMDFIDNLPTMLKLKQAKAEPMVASDDIHPDIAKYAGMVKVKSTPEIENLLDFDPASIATDNV